jgi:hypothetical protein
MSRRIKSDRESLYKKVLAVDKGNKALVETRGVFGHLATKNSLAKTLALKKTYIIRMRENAEAYLAVGSILSNVDTICEKLILLTGRLKAPRYSGSTVEKKLSVKTKKKEVKIAVFAWVSR